MLILLCSVTGTVTCSDGQGRPESSADWRPVRWNPAGPAFHSWPRFGQQAAERGRVGSLDLENLGAARGSGDQRDGAAMEAERGGHRGQRRLGRLAVDGARADSDDQGTAAFPAHCGPRRAGPYPDGNPHGTSLPLARFRDTLITVLSDGRR
jgi:hypothetical protein